jgi:non-heme chloroperoxidase
VTMFTCAPALVPNPPILAIYALPHERGITDPAKRAEADARDLAFQGAMAKAFEKGLPSAHIVWLAHANHYVFRSNEADVIREMNMFFAGLTAKSATVHDN